ncbi:MAG TPA: glycoside hydrolase family 3 C-terminal domain-containing protein [Acidimicrobiia bacterium]|jgi:beta-glucosidase
MSRDIAALVASMTVEEKAAFTAGADFWTLVANERVGIPPIRVTDGPNGARGSALFGLGDETAVCAPCGSALGATWDPELVERVGAMLGEEALTKACRVLLAPTVNLHRSPLGGRNFECYSEDPLLSGKTAAAFVRGVQSQGVVTTVKHFAGNDAEFERHSINSVIDDRTLRELTLVPFELAVREGGALGIMTAYNRLNGPHCSEHRQLITGILRGEWGYEGFVLTDWMSAGSTVGSSAAGLDLEMPGPGAFYGKLLGDAVAAGDVPERELDEHVTHLLQVFDRVGALDDDPAWASTSIDRPEHRALAREAAAAATVLLRNETRSGNTAVLPFDRSRVRTLAVLGPNAERPQMMGGGSANLAPHYEISLLDALRSKLGDAVDVQFARGVDIDRTTAPLYAPFEIEYFNGPEIAGEPVARGRYRSGKLLVVDPLPAGVDSGTFSFRATATYVPDESGTYTFALVQMAGRGRILLDGEVLLDGVADPPGPGTEFFGFASAESLADVELEAGRAIEVVVEFSVAPDAFFLRGMKLGLRRPSPPELLDRAVATAAAADAVIVMVGTNDDWETEGEDRASMDLPGRQDELVARAVAANPNTVVVVNTGSPVTMDWAGDAPAIVQAWFGGQEMGNALADVLFGEAEPGGRLPTTFPVRLEHNPSFGNFPGEFGELRYGEGALLGYRWYEARHLPTRFPFGHGLSYSTYAFGAPTVTSAADGAGDAVTVRVEVTNTGARRGAEVVQCYVAPPSSTVVTRAPKELKAFAKVTLDPGEATTIELTLDARAFAYWDPTAGDWHVAPGTYELHVGRSSADVAHIVSLERQ